MLGKMIIHGLIAAIVVGSGAAVYAQSKGDSAAATAPVGATSPAASPTASVGPEGNGYLPAPSNQMRRQDGDKRVKHEGRERHHDGRKRDHDDDDH